MGAPAFPTAAAQAEDASSADSPTAPQAAGQSGAFETARIRVMLTDDHVVVRQGLSLLLSEESDLQIVGEASGGNEAIALAERLRPDVILMDLSMPDMSGIDATRFIHDRLPDIRIIGLSMFEEADRASAMFEAGAVAYLTKSGSPEQLVAAIRRSVGR